MDSRSNVSIPTPVITRWLAPVRRFMQVEASSGVVLLICAAASLVLANSPWAAEVAALWKTPVSLAIGAFSLTGDVGHLLINDGLMTLFFFVVGLEVKREAVMGELRDPKKALLPIVGAVGGVIAPALIYLALQWGQEGQRGWAIPMATDIAFVVGCLALFGRRAPFGLKIFLLTLAIVDDIIAVVVIALIFSQSLAWGWLGAAALAFAIVFLLNRIGVRSIVVYFIIGVFIWLAFYQSGVHPTVAGVLLGLMTPASAWLGEQTLSDVVKNTMNESRSLKKNDYYVQLEFAAREAVSPLHRLETGLHPWVAFVIMPLFALCNAGVALDASMIGDSVAIAVALGLLIGKPVGILAFCYVAVKLGITRLPDKVNWLIFAGGGCLAGIGFTMALFMNSLSFPVAEFPVQEAAGKVGVFAGSILSVALGAVILNWGLRKKRVGS